MKDLLDKVESAPLAGYTDAAFRAVLRECGIATTWTEMISVTALFHGNEKTKMMLRESKPEQTVIQLFGKNPEHYKTVIESGVLDAFKEININMGCPARKITSNGDGCALMRNVGLARSIIEACVSTGRKISVKFRLGFAENTSVEFAKMCESAGASRIILHGRFGVQGYSGVADWDAIAEVVKAVKIPVIANGDIRNVDDLQKCAEVTEAAGFLVGRALIGCPWLFYNYGNPAGISTEFMLNIIKRHLELAENIIEMRKHLLQYADHFPNKKELKLLLCKVSSHEEALNILNPL